MKTYLLKIMGNEKLTLTESQKDSLLEDVKNGKEFIEIGDNVIASKTIIMISEIEDGKKVDKSALII